MGNSPSFLCLPFPGQRCFLLIVVVVVVAVVVVVVARRQPGPRCFLRLPLALGPGRSRELSAPMVMFLCLQTHCVLIMSYYVFMFWNMVLGAPRSAMNDKMLMSLTEGGMQYLMAGARASVGMKAGRYMYEVKIIEALKLC